MIGFNIAEAGHVAVILPPQNITGGVTAQAFSLANYKHASILIAAGAEATQDASTITLNVCSSAAGANPVAIPFNYYYQSAGGAGNDVLSAFNSTSGALTLSSSNFPANGLIVIEIDANELEASGLALGTDAYLQVVLGAPAAADYAAIIVVLSGARDSRVSSSSVTV